MSRFLFTVPPLAGHINPAAAVAAELTARGHRVAWAGAPDRIRERAGEWAEVFPCAIPDERQSGRLRTPGMRFLDANKVLWEEYFIPLADAMAPGVREAVKRFRPDAVVADQQTLAGALVAERLGIPYATSATTPAEFVYRAASLPKLHAWMDSILDGLRRRIGDAAADSDPRFSPYLTLLYTTRALFGETEVGPTVRLVGPCLAGGRSSARGRPADDFPWDWLDPGRATVLISLGTVNTDVGARFLGECAAAVRARSERCQAVVVDPAGLLERVRPGDRDVLVRGAVPQLRLLERTDAVICHAGHNTVAEALWHGIPLVVAPIRDDQPVVAGQVADSGAGVRVRFGRADREKLGAALDAVLDEPHHRTAARRTGDSFRAAGGARAAAGHLEELAAGRKPHGPAPGPPAPEDRIRETPTPENHQRAQGGN